MGDIIKIVNQIIREYKTIEAIAFREKYDLETMREAVGFYKALKLIKKIM